RFERDLVARIDGDRVVGIDLANGSPLPSVEAVGDLLIVPAPRRQDGAGIGPGAVIVDGHLNGAAPGIIARPSALPIAWLVGPVLLERGIGGVLGKAFD